MVFKTSGVRVHQSVITGIKYLLTHHRWAICLCIVNGRLVHRVEWRHIKLSIICAWCSPPLSVLELRNVWATLGPGGLRLHVVNCCCCCCCCSEPVTGKHQLPIVGRCRSQIRSPLRLHLTPVAVIDQYRLVQIVLLEAVLHISISDHAMPQGGEGRPGNDVTVSNSNLF